ATVLNSPDDPSFTNVIATRLSTEIGFLMIKCFLSVALTCHKCVEMSSYKKNRNWL
ncbi:hypothetical protein TNIN_297811, partial [Trichonephila inaurata madagascariensis]